jgi:hypothetical protein
MAIGAGESEECKVGRSSGIDSASGVAERKWRKGSPGDWVIKWRRAGQLEGEISHEFGYSEETRQDRRHKRDEHENKHATGV